MNKPAQAPALPDMSKIFQNQLDTANFTAEAHKDQRNGVMDSLTHVQVQLKLKNKQVAQITEQLNVQALELEKSKAQSEMWSMKFGQMAERASALAWFTENLMTELPENLAFEMTPEILGTVIENYLLSQAGEKMRENIVKVAHAKSQELAKIAAAINAPTTGDQKSDAEEVANTSVAQPATEKEDEVIQLKTSLAPKAQPNNG